MVKKRFGVGTVLTILLIILILSLAVFAARLPSVNGDNDAWGTVLNDFLKVAHEEDGNVKGSYITSSMIVNASVGAGDLALNSVNGSHIQTGAALNVTSIALTGGSTVNSSSNYTAVTITGMFVHTAQLDLPAITTGSCLIANITMLGLPAGSLCLPVMGEVFATGGATGAAASPLGGQNFTVTGLNSTINFCRLAVCAMNSTSGTTSINPPDLTYTVLAFTR